MNGKDDLSLAIRLGQQISAELAEYALPRQPGTAPPAEANEKRLPPGDELLAEYDRRITSAELRSATRSRFASFHYADAVEAGVKALNEFIRTRTGRTDDGDSLMTGVFSPSDPLLRINRGRSAAEKGEQRGHMMLCQGVVAAWRNPRAHALTDDRPTQCLMMLETINNLIETTRAAKRTRKRKP